MKPPAALNYNRGVSASQQQLLRRLFLSTETDSTQKYVSQLTRTG